LSYRGKKQGSYGNEPSRRAGGPIPRYKRTRRNVNDRILPHYNPEEEIQSNNPAPEDTQQSQAQTRGEGAKQTQPTELWLTCPSSLTFPGIDIKLPTSLEDLGRDAVTLGKLAKRKPELEIRDPQTKKMVKRFRILKKEDFEKEQTQKPEAERLEAPLTIDIGMGANQDIVGYFQGLKEELGKLGFMLVPTEGSQK
jgi:hypothetical protein